jgi:hypothetical protein
MSSSLHNISESGENNKSSRLNMSIELGRSISNLGGGKELYANHTPSYNNHLGQNLPKKSKFVINPPPTTH